MPWPPCPRLLQHRCLPPFWSGCRLLIAWEHAAENFVAAGVVVIGQEQQGNPLLTAVPLVLMQLGEVVFGGTGSGLYGMLIFAIHRPCPA